MDDEALIAAIATGDDVALRELFDRHAPWVGARVRRLVPDEAVEDVVQETFIAIWRGAKRYVSDAGAGAWIWGIARRQAALWLRKNGRAMPVINFATADDPELTATRRADLDQALALLGSAEDEGRELIRLVYVEDRPVAEVARLLAIPPGTVKSRLFNLRRRLRTLLLEGS